VKNLILTAVTTLGLTVATAPVVKADAAPTPCTLEQVVHANVRIMNGGAITGDNVPFPAFERAEVSAADILNGQELYHVNPSVIPAALGYGFAKAGGEIAHVAHHRAAGTSIVQSGHPRTRSG
jgi:hypothetical protein